MTYFYPGNMLGNYSNYYYIIIIGNKALLFFPS